VQIDDTNSGKDGGSGEGQGGPAGRAGPAVQPARQMGDGVKSGENAK